jgi:hypothetical protein
MKRLEVPPKDRGAPARPGPLSVARLVRGAVYFASTIRRVTDPPSVRSLYR